MAPLSELSRSSTSKVSLQIYLRSKKALKPGGPSYLRTYARNLDSFGLMGALLLKRTPHPPLPSRATEN